MSSWDSWGDDPDLQRRAPETVADHIRAYRESIQEEAARRKLSTEASQETQEQEKDLFAELAPKVQRQKKVYVGGTSESRGGRAAAPASKSRLGVQDQMADPFLAMVNAERDAKCIP